MTVVVHRDLGEIPRGEWNALASRAVTGTVFQTYEWHRAWIHAFGAAEGLRIVSVREAGGRFCFSSHNLESLTVRGARGMKECLKRVRRYRLLAAANENLSAARSTDRAMIRDASTDYRIPIYDIGPCAQIRQLEAAGFTDVQVFSLNSGREIDPREPDVRFADSWLYYLCRSGKS